MVSGQGGCRTRLTEMGQTAPIPASLLAAALANLLPHPSTVDCRIQVGEEGGLRVVTIAGRLLNDHVPGLLAACGQATSLRLDLTDVLSVDAIAADRCGGCAMPGRN